MNATERIRSMRLVGLLRGAERPDELVSALAAAGVEVVEVTPARAFGPAYVADLRKPLANVSLLCTGGVTAENAADFVAAGAVAVGISFQPGTTEAEARRAAEVVASAPTADDTEVRS